MRCGDGPSELANSFFGSREPAGGPDLDRRAPADRLLTDKEASFSRVVRAESKKG